MIIKGLKNLVSPSRIEVAGCLTKADKKMFRIMLPDVEMLAQKHDVFVRFSAQKGKDTKLSMDIFEKGCSHVAELPSDVVLKGFLGGVYIPWERTLYKSDDCGGFAKISDTVKRLFGYED